MKPKEYLMLFALAALWGASFLFIKVAVAEMSPLTLVGARLLLGALGLLVIVPFRPVIMHGWNTRLWSFFIVAIFNAVIPYLTISWGEEYISSGMAAILNATTPLVIALASQWWPGGERLTRTRVTGVIIGFVGVGVLVGPTALGTSVSLFYLLGVFAALAGAISYAFGALLAHRLLADAPALQPAIGQTGMGAVIIAPIAGLALVAQPPTHMLSPWAIGSVLVLALGGTSLAYLLYYRLIASIGPTRTLVVTYLLPCIALVYGALLLHESLGLNALAGLALVLTGIFVTGKKTEPSGAIKTVSGK